MKTYAAYYNDDSRLSSSSGGLFSLLSSKFDVIYGVAMTLDCQEAEFRRIDDGDISPLRGSKYLQAKVGKTFQLVKADLVQGKKVLFTGTICQVNGLKAYLQKEYSNLLTVDVVCHGVPAPAYWKKYIDGKRIESVNFRSKEGGWTNYTYGMKLNDKYIPYTDNKYMTLYIKNLVSRPSCYECVCKANKCSDITLGDFWGIEKLLPDMDDNKGTSLVIVRTAQGQLLFDSIQDDLNWKEVSYEDGVKQNPSEYESPAKPKNRDQFISDMKHMTFEELYSKYTHVPVWRKLVQKKNRIVKKIFGK